MAQNIDELQIEIETDATGATTGLDNLVKSLERLKKAVGANGETARGLKELVPALKDLGKLKSVNLTKNIKDLSTLGTAVRNITGADFSDFGVKINTIVDGLTKLASVKPGNLSATADGMRVIKNACSGLSNLNADFAPRLAAIGNSFTTLSSSSKNLNSVNFTQFEANIKSLSGSLQPLQGWRSQASSVLNALNGFPDAARALNEFDGFDAFGDKVKLLASKMQPLGEVRSKLGATLDALTRVSQVSEGLKSVDFGNFGEQTKALGNALRELNGVDMKLGSTLNNLSRVGTVSKELSDAMRGSTLKHDIKQLANALSGLNKIQKTNLGSVVNQLAKIPEVTKSLSPEVLDEFAIAVERLTGIVGPLAEKMQGIYNGFSILPGAIKRTINAMDGASSSSKRASGSFGGFFNSITRGITKLTVLGFALRKVATMFAGWLNESNSYIENLNLFTVTMGDATDAAVEYAKKVRDAMGIDVAGWMKYQGTFQQMATGFGVASDKAAIMSQNLTQLAYDLSSFFNVDVETAFDKISSGMSGQIKGLKEYGINLSVAALQEYALSKGITLKVSKMTEAQKSLLRYNLLMERSINAQGDMARTIITPANSLRILSAQLTQLKRALGNIVSVIAVKVIPYVQAFVRVITDAAEALAKAWGFKLPEIDYSGMSNAFADADEDADSLSGTLGEIKKQLMGFDELNVLSDPNAGGSGGALGGNDLDLDMASYDFLSGLDTAVDEVYNKVKTFLTDVYEGFNKYMPLISTLVVGAFGLLLSDKLIKAPGLIKEALEKAIGKVNKFKGAVKTSSIGKLAVGITGFAAAFIGVSGAVKNATLGVTNFGETALNLVAICGVVGVAMYSLMGWAGVIVAAIGAVAGAIYGYEAAAAELSRIEAEKQFFDGVGTSISDVADEFTRLTDGYTTFLTKVNENQGTIDANKASIQNLGNSIANMTDIMKTSSDEIAGEYLPQITEAFVEMEKAVTENINLVNDSIMLTLAAAPEDALARIGVSTEQIAKILGDGSASAAAELSKLSAERDKLSKLLEEDPNNAEYLEDLRQVSYEITKLSGEACPALNDFKSAIDLSNINYDDPEGAVEAIQKIKDAYKEATDEIDKNTQSQLSNIAYLENYLSTDDYETLKKSIIAAGTGQKEEVFKEYKRFGEEIMTEFSNSAEEVLSQHGTKWYEKIGGWIGSWGQDYSAADATTSLKLDRLGLGGIYGELCDWSGKIETETDNFAKIWEDLGASTVGFVNGIEDTIPDAEAAGTDLANGSLSGTQDGLDSHSPSKEFEKLGLYSVQGYVNGIVDNFSLVTDAWSRIFSDWFASVQREFSESKWSQLGTTAMNGLRKSLKLPELPKIKLEVTFDMRASADKQSVAKALGLSGWPNLKWKAYANGGFPAYGEMFIAKERGPELVGRIGNRSAVVNNDQIVASVAGGVYQGVAAAMRENGGGSGGTQRIEIRVPLEIGNRVLGEAVAEWNNDVVKQTGKSPLLT